MLFKWDGKLFHLSFTRSDLHVNKKKNSQRRFKQIKNAHVCQYDINEGNFVQIIISSQKFFVVSKWSELDNDLFAHKFAKLTPWSHAVIMMTITIIKSLFTLAIHLTIRHFPHCHTNGKPGGICLTPGDKTVLIKTKTVGQLATLRVELWRGNDLSCYVE